LEKCKFLSSGYVTFFAGWRLGEGVKGGVKVDRNVGFVTQLTARLILPGFEKYSHFYKNFIQNFD